MMSVSELSGLGGRIRVSLHHCIVSCVYHATTDDIPARHAYRSAPRSERLKHATSISISSSSRTIGAPYGATRPHVRGNRTSPDSASQANCPRRPSWGHSAAAADVAAQVQAEQAADTTAAGHMTDSRWAGCSSSWARHLAASQALALEVRACPDSGAGSSRKSMTDWAEDSRPASADVAQEVRAASRGSQGDARAAEAAEEDHDEEVADRGQGEGEEWDREVADQEGSRRSLAEDRSRPQACVPSNPMAAAGREVLTEECSKYRERLRYRALRRDSSAGPAPCAPPRDGCHHPCALDDHTASRRERTGHARGAPDGRHGHGSAAPRHLQ